MTTKFLPYGRLTTVSNRADISNATSEFSGRMTQNSDRAEEMQLGFQGGGMPAMVHWRADIDLWFAFSQTEKRHWVAFGVGNPFKDGSTSIVVEINSPFAGINRRIGGVFIQNQDGELFLGHRGRVGGGRKGIGQQAFMAGIGPDNLVKIRDGDRPTQVIMIGALANADLPDRVNWFVREVERFKLDTVSAGKTK